MASAAIDPFDGDFFTGLMQTVMAVRFAISDLCFSDSKKAIISKTYNSSSFLIVAVSIFTVTTIYL